MPVKRVVIMSTPLGRASARRKKRQNVSFRHKNSLQPRQLMRITLFKKE
jgi:hypothetical protein